MDSKPTDLFEKYKDIVVHALGSVLTNPNQYSANDPLFVHKKIIDDLGADSLDQVEIIMNIEEHIKGEIPDEEAEKAITVLDAILVAMKHDGIPQSEIDFVRKIHPVPGTPVAVRRSLKDKRDPSKTDWSKADAKTDADIAVDVASDPDAAPLLQEGEDLGKIVRPHLKHETPANYRLVFRNHDDLRPIHGNYVMVPVSEVDQLVVDRMIESLTPDRSMLNNKPIYVRRPGTNWHDLTDRFNDQQEEPTVLHNKRMSQETMDQIVDEATHAALTVLQSSGIYVNSMQTDALNDSITVIVRGDNDNRSED